jgi:hypothetical protein
LKIWLRSIAEVSDSSLWVILKLIKCKEVYKEKQDFGDGGSGVIMYFQVPLP